MNANERRYRKLIGTCGLSMLLFWGLVNLFGFGIILLDSFLLFLPISEVLSTVLSELLYGLGYSLSFMIPAFFFRFLLSKSAYPYLPMHTEYRLSPRFLLMIPAGIALIFSAAYVNMGLVSVFNYSNFSSEFLWGEAGSDVPAYYWILQLITVCVVPGFCEEFLFRGTILTNLLPFGRSAAVLISSFLFALMHQNPEQFFYTFAAGIVLGIVYEQTRNIWACTILHMLNNAVSLFESMLTSGGGSPVHSSLYLTVFELLLMLAGVVCIAILIAQAPSRRNRFQNGIFGKSLPATDGYAECPVEGKRACKLFLTPAMIIFLVISLLQMMALLILAVLYGSLL